MKRLPYIPAGAMLAIILARNTGGIWEAAGSSLGAAFGGLFSLLAWCLTVVAFGWFAFPLFRRLFGELPDQGWFLARWAGLFFAGWGAWALASTRFLVFWPWGALISLTVMGGSAWTRIHRGRARETGMPASVRLWIGGGELLFWGVFGVLLLARLLNPDLLSASTGGEKPMELAILNAIIRASHFPPADPWLAGHTLNYYYFGYVPYALLIRLTGVPASVGFNLAVPTLGAFAAVAAFLSVGTLVGGKAGARPEGKRRGRRASFLPALSGPLLLLGIGNLFEPRLVASGFRRLGEVEGGVTIPLIGPLWQATRGFFAWLFQGAAWPYSLSSLYWSATRIIPHPASEAAPISEFPLFSMLFADLHPHLIALPALLFVVLALLAGDGNDGPTDQPAGRWRAVITGGFLGIVVLINPWELPLVLLLTIGALFVLPRFDRTKVDRLGAGLTLLSAVVILLPHLLTYQSPIRGVRLWEGSGTSLAAFLWIHGLFVLTIVWWLWSRLPDRKRGPGWRGLVGSGSAGIGLSALVAVTLLQATGLISGAAWLVSLLAVALLVLFLRTPLAGDRKITGLLLLGCLLALVPEFFALNGDVGRMNLVFKLYFEIWCLWSIGCAASLVWLLSETTGGAASWMRSGWRASLALVLAASLSYPPLAFWARALDRSPGATALSLDGLAALADIRYPWRGKVLTLKDDLAVIHWLQENVQGAPVLVEAVTDDYGPGGRLSSATGLPSILGWPGHEVQQRQAWDFRGEVRRRQADVRDIYSSRRGTDILPVLERYRVGYIVVGELERAVYGEDGLGKFEAETGVWWERVFTSGATAVYAVRERRK